MSKEAQKTEVVTAQNGGIIPPDLESEDAPSRKDARFWFILLGLLLSTFIAVLEAVGVLLLLYTLVERLTHLSSQYAVSTALPVIVSDLNADQFVWIASAYAIAGTVILPLVGGLSQVCVLATYVSILRFI